MVFEINGYIKNTKPVKSFHRTVTGTGTDLIRTFRSLLSVRISNLTDVRTMTNANDNNVFRSHSVDIMMDVRTMLYRKYRNNNMQRDYTRIIFQKVVKQTKVEARIMMFTLANGYKAILLRIILMFILTP